VLGSADTFDALRFFLFNSAIKFEFVIILTKYICGQLYSCPDVHLESRLKLNVTENKLMKYEL